MPNDERPSLGEEIISWIETACLLLVHPMGLAAVTNSAVL